MRTLVLSVVLACGGPTAIPVTERVTVPTNMQDAGGDPPADAKKASMLSAKFKSGPGEFPIPADADDGTQMLGKDVTFQIPRARDAVHKELVDYIKTQGYTVESEQLYMGGYRMEISRRDGKTYSVSVTENEAASTLMTVTAK
ncbi:MAG: hypothetical protein H0V17_32010 [Deltaproteobacteria bacterium]|nr:hypothetical protein [Deltaproteobacteria bacterium]